MTSGTDNVARASPLIPEPVEETSGRLRHLGARRERLIVEASGQFQHMRDLIECAAWPAALESANWPFRSRTWAAALWVILALTAATWLVPAG